MTQILLVEDEQAVSKPLADHLEREGYAVLIAQNGKEANSLLKQNPDLAVIDWMLPDVQGIELLKKWRSAAVSIPIIMLTARADLVDKVLGLELGANDYLTKPFEPRELIARIRVQLRGRAASIAVSSDLQVGKIKLSLQSREAWFDQNSVSLTKTEFDLLKVFLENPNQVFSREELLKKVWGYDRYPTTRTVDTHVLQLRQKFGEEAFETVHRIGYRFREKR